LSWTDAATSCLIPCPRLVVMPSCLKCSQRNQRI
jgi:hypothetical protein